MVADRIVVTNCCAATSQAWTWSSSGGSGPEIAPASEDDAGAHRAGQLDLKSQSLIAVFQSMCKYYPLY
jgi:HSP90 family molecular chaperone